MSHDAAGRALAPVDDRLVGHPALEEPAAGSRPRSSWIVVSLAFAIFFLLPGDVALAGPLRSNGTPLRLLGLIAFFLFLAGFLRSDLRHRMRPVAGVLVAYLAFAFLAWGTANLEALTLEESAQVDRFVLITVSGVGIALLTSVVVNGLERAHRLLGWLTAGAVLAVVVGFLQFVGAIDKWADFVTLPGMVNLTPPMGVVDRLGFNRVPGTTSSPLEYSVVLAAVLPLVIHLAIHGASRAARAGAMVAVGLVLLGLPLALSRSGMLTVLVAFVVMLAFLPPARRWRMLLVAALAAAAGIVLAPSVTGALGEIVLGARQDYSIQGRLGDYPEAMRQFAASPWFGGGPAAGRGFATVLDNQWLVTLVRDGLVGVAGLAVLLLGGAVLAAKCASRLPSGSAGRTFQGALCAGLVGIAVAAGTFDVLSFQQANAAIFLLLGLVGVGEHTRRDQEDPPADVRVVSSSLTDRS